MNDDLVLAVDDDPTNLSLIRSIFEDSSLHLRLAQGGVEALRILNEADAKVGLVILDRIMPVLDGMAVLERMRQNPRLSDVPVIIQTAAASPQQVEEGLKAGAYYYLTKPYEPEALRTIVESALEDGRRRQQIRDSERLAWLSGLESASFSFRTLEEAEQLAELLSRACPDSAAAWTGLHELLVNAVEHGNLCVSYEEKARLKRENRWREEVDRRAELPEYRDRRVRLSFYRTSTRLHFVISDEGSGFPWRRYLQFALRAPSIPTAAASPSRTPPAFTICTTWAAATARSRASRSTRPGAPPNGPRTDALTQRLLTKSSSASSSSGTFTGLVR